MEETGGPKENFAWITAAREIPLPGGGSIPSGTRFPCFPGSQMIILREPHRAPFHALAGMWACRKATGTADFDHFLKAAGFPFPWAGGKPPAALVSLEIGAFSLSLFEENIAGACCEVLVNAANEGLWMGGGVAGALRSRGGYDIEAAARKFAPTGLGGVVETHAGTLNALKIYHAVVIDQHHMTRSELPMAEACFKKVLETAMEEKASGVTVPMLGCGVGGLETADVAASYLKTCEEMSKTARNPLMVVFCERDPDNIKTTAEALSAERTPLKDDKEVMGFLEEYEKRVKGGEGPK